MKCRFLFDQIHNFTQQYGDQEDSDGAQECVGNATNGTGKQGAVHENMKNNIFQRIFLL